jgi:hypothetical protein
MDKEQLRQKLLDAFTDALADVLDEAFPAEPLWDNPYKMPLEEVPIPAGFEPVRDELGRIVCRKGEPGEYVLLYGECYALHLKVPCRDPRIIVRKIEPKPEPCVVVREKREVEVETTYRKVATRKAKPGEFIGTGVPDNPVTPWCLDYESYSDWDIYEPVKEVSK